MFVCLAPSKNALDMWYSQGQTMYLVGIRQLVNLRPVHTPYLLRQLSVASTHPLPLHSMPPKMHNVAISLHITRDICENWPGVVPILGTHRYWEYVTSQYANQSTYHVCGGSIADCGLINNVPSLHIHVVYHSTVEYTVREYALWCQRTSRVSPDHHDNSSPNIDTNTTKIVVLMHPVLQSPGAGTHLKRRTFDIPRTSHGAQNKHFSPRRSFVAIYI